MAEYPVEPLEALTLAAAQLRETSTIDQLLQIVVDAAVAVVPACAYAGVSVDRGGRMNSPVVSDPAVLRIDSLQYTIGNGPCLLAMRGPEVLIDSADLQNDPRFTTFGAEAGRDGLVGVIAHRLYVDSQTLGSLNLYSDGPGRFTSDDRRHLVVLAALASFALNMLQLQSETGGLREAIRTRDLIGQAKGILMARQQLSEPEAFAHLTRLSQHQNRKVRDIAQDIVDSSKETDR